MADVGALIASFQVHRIRRYFRQVHWLAETQEAEFADRAEPGLKLENVAAHSWHVADAVMLLAPHFELDASHALKLTVLHDKLEMFTGDYDPVGADGKGTYSHAFHSPSQRRKLEAERTALEAYLATLRSSARKEQRALLDEIIFASSTEALFVKAVDKLQAMAFLCVKKRGMLSDDHLIFTINYSRKSIKYFYGLQTHYVVLLNRLLDMVAAARSLERSKLDRDLFSQYELDLRPPL